VANLDSVGKAIHRHVNLARREGLGLIESPARGTTRLFALNASADEISYPQNPVFVRKSV
jgi:hypothetical protein